MAGGHPIEHQGKGLEAEAEGASHGSRGPEEEKRRGNGDQAPQADLTKFVAGHSGGGAEGDIIAFFQVAGVVDDHAKADGEAEKDLAGGGQPHFGVGKGPEQAGQASADVPHLGEAGDDVAFGMGGIGRAESQDADQDEQGTKD